MSSRVAVTVLAAGVAASAALGEFIPFLASVSGEFSLSLGSVGWLSSVITLVAGLTCLPLGIWMARRRLRGLFGAALVVLGAAGLGTAFVVDPAGLFALRVVQAVGYAVVVVAGPGLLTRLLEGGARQAALALWGLCVPAGLTLASTVAALVGAAGWRGEVIVVGGLTLVVAGWAATMASDVRPGGHGQDGDRPAGPVGAGWAVAALAAGFAMIALVGVSLVTVLPAYLTEEAGLAGPQVSLLTGLVSASSAVGSLVAGASLRAGVRPGRLVAAALLMAPLTAGVFLGMPVPVVVSCAAVVLGLNGLAVSAMFAVAGGRPAWWFGAVTQAGSLGTLLGPPLYAGVVETSGWSAAIVVTAAIVCGGVGCATTAIRRSR
ncbi:MFS transporter [Nonomuraea sp. NPDC049709]|uniref:MFS transporter n=1 Tax=Nonomuraea sp. NPDC049709 TaxID=3154736 RepID=UPI00343FDCC4